MMPDKSDDKFLRMARIVTGPRLGPWLDRYLWHIVIFGLLVELILFIVSLVRH